MTLNEFILCLRFWSHCLPQIAYEQTLHIIAWIKRPNELIWVSGECEWKKKMRIDADAFSQFRNCDVKNSSHKQPDRP